MHASRGFTLVELLVAIAIVALLVVIAAPMVRAAQQAARSAADLSNMRALQIAHVSYMNDNKGAFINVGLSHGGAHAHEDVAWINTLQKHYGNRLLARSPLDTSPHWGPYPDGEPIPGSPTDQRRRTSYGANNFVTDIAGTGQNPYGAGDPLGGDSLAYDRLNRISQPAKTVQFIHMAQTGAFAGADHPHVENWGGNVPVQANKQVQINVVDGVQETPNWKSRSNYGFVDGHAETLRFEQVYRDENHNKFNPIMAR